MSRRPPFRALESLNKSAVETGRVELSRRARAADDAAARLLKAKAKRQSAELEQREIQARERERLERGAIRISDLVNEAHWTAKTVEEAQRLREVERALLGEEQARQKEKAEAETLLAQHLAEGRALERHQLRLEKLREQSRDQKEEDAATDLWNTARATEKRGGGSR